MDTLKLDAAAMDKARRARRRNKIALTGSVFTVVFIVSGLAAVFAAPFAAAAQFAVFAAVGMLGCVVGVLLPESALDAMVCEASSDCRRDEFFEDLRLNPLNDHHPYNIHSD